MPPKLGKLNALVLVGASLAGGALSRVTHFRPENKAQLPTTFFQHLCGEAKEEAVCLKDFEESGAVWAGDVNDDGVDEFIVDAGGTVGTLGPTREIIQLQAKSWVSLACLGGDCSSWWNSLHARFEILPITRGGYHDLRIEVGHCLKWDGRKYIDYADSDYHQLREEWFDSKDSREAELFWKIRYSGDDVVQLKPMWFTVSPGEFNRAPRPYIGFPVRVIDFPKLPYESLRDPERGLKWVSFFKGGVWGVKGNRAFLLVPQPSYLGAQRLQLHGDWLYIYGELEQTSPTVAYNRRTGELRYNEGQQDH